ncbi:MULTISPECIES: ATP-binding protein [unclassified Rhizobium]|uniref:ATP-binding protein n=1 Tax=unclassified Rhizobium TaxID=2613769 RepID=UPI00178005D9|nr:MULTISPECIES: ATP-binding protein [unclassified Rhizobium]MBD8688876.1 sensor histidine kinase N-terminal domain-containing protein [Rhizobium sp. CFBP 13644]MBD8694153.1 sensor histidine kinase N-terminal domain-containing protein [Rhizobium sp. CFBP 13717]
MTSIRTRLFFILLITTGIVWLSATAWIYHSTRSEVERVLDARLTEAARMVSSLITSQEINPAKKTDIPSEIATMHTPYERQLSCQIWALDGTLIGRSDAAPGQPLTENRSGFSETLVDGETWRVYAVVNETLGMRVLVGDNMRVRNRLVTDVIQGLALPALLILPVLAGLIWLSVRKGLAPLSSMAEKLGTRPASDLSALPDDNSPSEIKPVIRSLNGLFARVTAAREHERDFTAFAAHELRTPIAGLRTQAQIALGSDNEDIRKNALRQIVVGVDRTARLVRQLTDLTNAESGQAGSQDDKVNLGEILKTLAADIKQHYPTAAVIDISPQLFAVTIVMDVSLFMLCARNLLENAVLHSLADQSVQCGVWTAQGVVGVFIDDSGPGIPEEEFSKVCDRFFRGRNKTTMGSGLGLAIAYLAAERLDVEITLQNRTEGGLRAGLRFRSVTRVP